MFFSNANDGWLWLRLSIDVLCVWGLLYYGLKLIKNNSRTIQIVKGLLFLMVIKYLASSFHLIAIATVLDTFLNWGVILVLIVFQPEIRSILERMGRSRPIFQSPTEQQQVKKMIDEIVSACKKMSKQKTGALISLEMGQSLQDYIANGTTLDSKVSQTLLEQLFEYGTPTHDGAVIIRDGRIASAASYLPNTSKDLPLKYGARHRAALGLSEITDSITIIVSEESGDISIASRGQLISSSPENLELFLEKNLLIEEPAKDKNQPLAKMKNTFEGVKGSVSSHLSARNTQPQSPPEPEPVSAAEPSEPKEEKPVEGLPEPAKEKRIDRRAKVQHIEDKRPDGEKKS